LAFLLFLIIALTTGLMVRLARRRFSNVSFPFFAFFPAERRNAEIVNLVEPASQPVMYK